MTTELLSTVERITPHFSQLPDNIVRIFAEVILTGRAPFLVPGLDYPDFFAERQQLRTINACAFTTMSDSELSLPHQAAMLLLYGLETTNDGPEQVHWFRTAARILDTLESHD